MSRSRPRTSRILLIVLALTVCIGGFTIAAQYRKSRDAKEAAAKTAAPSVAPATSLGVAPPSSAVPEGDGALVTQTPTVKPVALTTATPAAPAPAPKPAARVAATGPTTRRATTGPAVALSDKPLADAKALADAGKLLEARDVYNAALASDRLSPAEAKQAKAAMAALNDTIVFSSRRFPADPWCGTFKVPPGGVMAKIAQRFGVTSELLCRVNKISDPRRLQAGQTIKTVNGPFHGVVDKNDFTIDLYLGTPGGPESMYVTTYRVGLGADDSTPLGTWQVTPGKKLTNPTYHSPPSRGGGIIEADDPQNPLGEYWIGLTGVDGAAVGQESYGIHGTIEPDSIGKMESMGCIRLVNEDVGRVYEMLVEGKSTVVVQD